MQVLRVQTKSLFTGALNNMDIPATYEQLEQWLELVEGIKTRGGAAFLEGCDHLVGVRGSRWDGRGTASRFIRRLIAAYEVALGKACSPS